MAQPTSTDTTNIEDPQPPTSGPSTRPGSGTLDLAGMFIGKRRRILISRRKPNHRTLGQLR
jgi:hypothetical protein